MKKIIIDNIETTYLINEQGEIFNTVTNKYLSGSVFNNGYRMVRLTINGSKKAFGVHRLVAQTFLPNPLNLPVVNHKDGNKLNNTLENLEWVTYSENSKHACKTKLNPGNHGKKNFRYDIKEGSDWKRYLDTNYLVDKNGKVYNEKTHILLTPVLNNKKYWRYTLTINHKIKTTLAHRMVFTCWGDKPLKDKDIINHIDGDPSNNNIDNLEIVTKAENANHAHQVLKHGVKGVQQFDKDNIFIAEYVSMSEAARQIGGVTSGISYAVKNNKKYYNYYWRLIEK